MGSVISQKDKPIAFYRNISLGQQIKLYTDLENLEYKTFNTERVMRLRLILVKYNPELINIQSSKNITADA